jgi:PqqD family protein of HPr-rel-A system
MHPDPCKPWRLTGGDALRWVCWGREYSVFDALTGETHFIDTIPAEILSQLTQGPLTAQDLSHRMAQLCETDDNAEWAARIAGVLFMLEGAELIEAATP